MKTILCPIDFSPKSENAATYAYNLAIKNKARLVLLNVHSGMSLDSDKAMIDTERIKDKMELSCEQLKRKHFSSLVSLDFEVKDGKIDEQILQSAHDNHAELIIMGNPDNSFNKSENEYSISDQIIISGVYPVLLVPPNARYQSIRRLVIAADLPHDEKLTRFVSTIATPAAHISSINLTEENISADISSLHEYLGKENPFVNSPLLFSIIDFVRNQTANFIVIQASQALAKSFFTKGAIEELIKQTGIPIVIINKTPNPEPDHHLITNELEYV